MPDHGTEPSQKGTQPLGDKHEARPRLSPGAHPAATYPLELSKKSSWLCRASERLRGGQRCSARAGFLCAGPGVLQPSWEPSPKATPEQRNDIVLHLDTTGEKDRAGTLPGHRQPQGRALAPAPAQGWESRGSSLGCPHLPGSAGEGGWQVPLYIPRAVAASPAPQPPTRSFWKRKGKERKKKPLGHPSRWFIRAATQEEPRGVVPGCR